MGAFLNALREEGTKADCIQMLEKMWSDEIELRAALTAEREARLKAEQERDALKEVVHAAWHCLDDSDFDEFNECVMPLNAERLNKAFDAYEAVYPTWHQDYADQQPSTPQPAAPLTDEDVEWVARAIYVKRPFVLATTETSLGYQVSRTFDWDGAPHYYQEDIRDLARAAIEALRGK